jgi:hypothetical protein
LVALPPVRDLLLCAKYLFVAAILAGQPAGGRPRTHEGGEGAENDRGGVVVSAPQMPPWLPLARSWLWRSRGERVMVRRPDEPFAVSVSPVLINRDCFRQSRTGRKRRVRIASRRIRRSSSAVATSREGHRSPRSGRAGQHRRWDRARSRSRQRS